MEAMAVDTTAASGSTDLGAFSEFASASWLSASADTAAAAAPVAAPLVVAPAQPAEPAPSSAAVATMEVLMEQWIRRLTSAELRELLVNLDIHRAKIDATQRLAGARRKLSAAGTAAAKAAEAGADGRSRTKNRSVKLERGTPTQASRERSGPSGGSAAARRGAGDGPRTPEPPLTRCSWLGCNAVFPSLTLMLNHLGEAHERPAN